VPDDPEVPRLRPEAVGYLTLPDGLDGHDRQWFIEQWRAVLAEFATRQGYVLGPVFVDVRGRGEPALYELVDHVRRTSTAAIVVPDLDHLHRTACLTGADRLAASRFLRAPVLTVDLRPADLLSAGGGAVAHLEAAVCPAIRAQCTGPVRRRT
jgi:hypothetical protein